MRYYNAIIEKNLTFKQALKKMKKGQAITRPCEWDGIHVPTTGEKYIILLKDGSTVINPTEIMKSGRTDKDWAVVMPTKRAVERLKGLV